MNRRIAVQPTAISGVAVCVRQALTDVRGSFERLYCAKELEAVLGGAQIAQMNLSLTVKRGTIRGLHFQRAPHAEVKVVTCVRGAIFDVAVDLRRGSPTYLRWHSERLEEGDHRSLVIPRGCAHGFQALSDRCEVLYLHTAPFVAECEGGVDALDPAIGVKWPVEVAERSDRDSGLPQITAGFQALEL